MNKLTTLRTHYRTANNESIFVSTIPFEPIAGCLLHYDSPGYTSLVHAVPWPKHRRQVTGEPRMVDKWQNIQREMILYHRRARADLKRLHPGGRLSVGSDVLPRLPPKR